MIKNEKGFSVVEVLLIVVIVGLVGFVGWYVWHSKNNTSKSQTDSTSNGTTINKTDAAATRQPTKDPTADWQTFTDTSGSGLSVKYPTGDWQVQTESKVWAWFFEKKADSKTTIGFKWIVDNNSKTPKQEWDNCSSLDACGHQPSDKLLDAKTATINGSEAYQAKMQGDSGVYHATILKSNKSSSNGQVYVEVIVYSDDTDLVNLFNQVVGTASF
jgi:Tfp pilus assembly protein PilV